MPRFRLLMGRHSEGKGSDGKTLPQPKIYVPGDIIDSPVDLTKFNGPNANKFERVMDDPPVSRQAATVPASTAPQAGKPPPRPASKELESMTEQELRQLAEDVEVDVKSARNKADLVKVLKAAGAS